MHHAVLLPDIQGIDAHSEPNHRQNTPSDTTRSTLTTSMVLTNHPLLGLTPLWQDELKDPGMSGHSMHKYVEKFHAKSMKKLKNFTTSAIAFHVSDVGYFNEADH
ncbi:hypothetical protein GX50_01039 [[Emmonsia] crescens]|uniref:Uncharacterized protein n=1 Tax=[Emmonsia] crescens TaxID=73230 RepID=A0A2B7ZSK6_9EURO|nr:hypothetical protein GX50_01039 [Emmonsia crescens]